MPGAVFVGNAFGKLAGSTQVDELGTIESPDRADEHALGRHRARRDVRWTIAQPGNENVRSVNALVGETNDGGLNDIRGLHVTREHVTSPRSSTREAAVDEGAVGAGTGTIAFGWKGGIGTSSRVTAAERQWTVGVLVQSNYGGRLTIAGVPVWRELTAADLPARAAKPQRLRRSAFPRKDAADGSCMIVVATDAPLDARDLKRLAARRSTRWPAPGSTYSNGSGDFAIAFSTHASLTRHGASGPQPRTVLPTDSVSGLFEAVMDATEEAVYNSLLKAVDTTGNGRTVRALPIDGLKTLLKIRYNPSAGRPSGRLLRGPLDSGRLPPPPPSPHGPASPLSREPAPLDCRPAASAVPAHHPRRKATPVRPSTP